MIQSPKQKSLWQWSLDVYAHTETQIACLLLQDRYQLDVNTLLWLCWLAYGQKTPTAHAIDYSIEISTYWQSELIAGIRKSRRQISKTAILPSHQNLKKQFLKLEFLAERQQQNELEALMTIPARFEKLTTRTLCQNNLDLYLAAIQEQSPDCARATENLCTTIFNNA